MDETADHRSSAPPVAQAIFGAEIESAARYVALLAGHGVERGVIGPREVGRLWERHVLNSAVLGELISIGSSVIDVGSGAGLPGVPLGIVRPDLDIVVLEPMARRVDWLQEVVSRLEMPITVIRGRAEESAIREKIGGADVVTARALAPLARLGAWCLPLVRPEGAVLAMKGASVHEEVRRDRDAVYSAGAGDVRVVTCGAEVLETPTTAVSMIRAARKPRHNRRAHRSRQSHK